MNTFKAHKTHKPIKAPKQISNEFQIVPIPNGLKNGPVKCKPKRTAVAPEYMPKLPIMVGGFGVVKSGKSNALVNMIQAYWNAKSINLLYCISPTYHSNTSLQTLPFEEDGIYTDTQTCVSALHKIVAQIKQKHEDYLFEKEYKRIYKKFRSQGEQALTFEEINLLVKENYRSPIHIPWPSPGIFIDDMTHTELMSNTINNALSHLCLHHRHIAEPDLGVSLFMAFQTFKSGLPRVIRSNLEGIMLFPTCNMEELVEIHREVGNNVTFDTFKKIFFEATKERHSFLFINKMEDDPAKQFGINFDQKFIVDPVEERLKLIS